MRFVKLFPIFLILIFGRSLLAQEPVPVKKFETSNANEREEAIANAPVCQKQELEQIHFHLIALERLGSEVNLRQVKERAVSDARGFVSLNRLSADYANLWDQYMIQVERSNEEHRVSSEIREKVEHDIQLERQFRLKRLATMHGLVFQLAPTETAFKLEVLATTVRRDKLYCVELNAGTSPQLSHQSMIDADRGLIRILSRLKKLPALKRRQVEEEYDRFPDRRL